MGSHAKPRTRVRSAALGTLAVGATLTGVGLTAAALDPGDATLADGTIGTDPVDFAASGLGAPVPVVGVNSSDGVAASNGTVSSSAGTKSGANDEVSSATPGDGHVSGGGGTGSYTAERMALPVGASAQQLKRAEAAGAAVVRSSRTGASSGSASAGFAAQGARSALVPSGAGASSGGTAPLGLPPFDTSLPIDTALPVPSLTSASSLSTTVGQTKSTVARLLDELARLV
ncbi:MAG TPA: hypothetical protein VGS97_13515 [Actinocrinis sp.]|uniref:hypothetical protein n=1 Tax=Actinocrinis sp. TaxID=1920516 RepID=UPI002DDCD92E|nr:hypothetical protein [Actinocrinis sp.]HEV2345109.1 hypothetical protein [Actinocrinis sp.]